MSVPLNRTPLYEQHLAHGGKMVSFAGWEMPVQYESGITAEHHAVRQRAGLFDVSHMGEFEIRGPQALDLVQRVSTNDAAALEPGQAQYSTLPQKDGTLLDDLLVYRYSDRFMLVVNASNRARDLEHILAEARGFDAGVTDRTDEVALLALQGPAAARVLAPLTATHLGGIGYYRFAEGIVAGTPMTISRTGYTGEDGFELYMPASAAPALWRRLLGAGEEEGLVPAGLGARDSLRLEMGYALYGNDLDETRTPLEGGLGWVVKPAKGDFVGREALLRQKEKGIEHKLAGFRLLERGFPRPGYEIWPQEGDAAIGTVTSGTLSPTLGEGIGMGYVPAAQAAPGTPLRIMVRGKPLAAQVVRPPFYTQGSLKR